MASGEIIDIDALLQDIPGENRYGESLRWEPIYDEMKAARPQGDRDALVEGEGVDGNWPFIIETATDILTNRSKDLQFAAWLTEAITHQSLFAGLRDGLLLMARLVDEFWDGIYPEIDEDGDLDVRVAPLVWITEEGTGARLPNALRDLPLTRPDFNEQTYGLNDYNRRIPQPKGPEEGEESVERRRVEAEEIGKKVDDAIAGGDAAYYLQLYEDITGAIDAVAEFGTKTDARFGFTSPSTTAMKSALEECQNLIHRIATDKGAFLVEEETSDDGDDSEEGEGGGGGGGRGGPVKTRQEAMVRLQEVAGFLRRTEPHSPVSYLVQRAVHWSDMPLDRLLPELVKDSTSLEFINELLGIRPSGEEQAQQDDW